MTLWLIGMMGSGKTTVGKLLAEELGIAFADTDREVERLAGAPIIRIWHEEGEGSFREIEKKAVARLATQDAVISTGGGVPMDAGNRSAMANTGKTVWLRADPEILALRLVGGDDRPLINSTADPIATLRRLLEERAPVYARCADLVLDTDEKSPETTVEVIVDWLNR